MNRWYNQFRLSLEKRIVDLYCSAAIGAAGAPTISASASKGIASIARNSAGNYTITLSDKYVSLLAAHPTLVLAAGAPATASSAQMIVRSAGVSSATPTVVVEFVDNAGAAIELTNGVTLGVKLELKATSV